MLSSVVVVVALGLAAPSQGAAQPAGRRFVLQESAELKFTVPTNVGPVSGTVEVQRLDTRGIEGWGRFEMRFAVDPDSVDTGDALRDDFIRRTVFGGSPISFASTDRVSPKYRPGTGKVPTDEMFSAVAWMDARRRHRRLELFYTWKGSADEGVLRIEHQADWRSLGFQPITHPFVSITGPVQFSLEAKLARTR